jgi:hypothetical protein
MLKLEEDETLVCIEAPGTVESPDRFLQMIGGTLNMVISSVIFLKGGF